METKRNARYTPYCYGNESINVRALFSAPLSPLSSCTSGGSRGGSWGAMDPPFQALASMVIAGTYYTLRANRGGGGEVGSQMRLAVGLDIAVTYSTSTEPGLANSN